MRVVFKVRTVLRYVFLDVVFVENFLLKEILKSVCPQYRRMVVFHQRGAEERGFPGLNFYTFLCVVGQLVGETGSAQAALTTLSVFWLSWGTVRTLASPIFPLFSNSP